MLRINYIQKKNFFFLNGFIQKKILSNTRTCNTEKSKGADSIREVQLTEGKEEISKSSSRISCIANTINIIYIYMYIYIY